MTERLTVFSGKTGFDGLAAGGGAGMGGTGFSASAAGEASVFASLAPPAQGQIIGAGKIASRIDFVGGKRPVQPALTAGRTYTRGRPE